MIKKQRGLLLTALTLLLCFAILSATIAAPSLHFVQTPTKVQSQTLVSAAAGEEAGQFQKTALRSPALISSKAQAPGSRPDARFYEHKKTNGVVDAPAVLTEWPASGHYLDIFSMEPEPAVSRDAALPANTYADQILVPGTKGTYHFTLKNLETFECYYEFTITKPDLTDKGDPISDLPMEFRLRDGGGSYFTAPAAAYKIVTDIPKVTGTLAGGASREFQLDWLWSYEESGAQDIEDTAFGRQVDDPMPPLYQLVINYYLEAEEQEVIVKFDPKGGIVSPTQRTYQIGDKLGALPTPTRAGYTFDGWYDKDGNLVTEDTLVTGDDMILYARWTKNDNNNWWLWLLPLIPIPILGWIGSMIPVLISIPVVGSIPIILSNWICWKCLHLCKDCTCNGTCHNPKCPDPDKPDKPDDDDDVTNKPAKPSKPPKTGDSSTAIYITIAVLLASLLGALIILLKKRKNDDDDSDGNDEEKKE